MSVPRADESVRRRTPKILVVAAGLTAIAATVAALAYGHGADREIIPSLPSPGPVTGWGLPLARLISELAAAIMVGNLTAAVFWSPRSATRTFQDAPQQPRRLLTPVACAHIRVARWAAAAWAVTSMAQWLFTISDLRGLPVTQILSIDALSSIGLRTSPGQAGAVVVTTAAIGTLLCWRPASVSRVVAALTIGVFGLLPPTFVGHAVSSANHRTAISSLLLHILAATLWVGGLAALLTRAAHHRRSLPRAVARYSRLALACFLVTGATGALNAYLRLAPSDTGISSPYGTLIVAKILALGVLGGFGWWHRTRTLPALERGQPRQFLRFAAVEILVLAATVGIAAGLARTPTPLEAATADESPAEQLLGYQLPTSISIWRLLADWWPDLFYLCVCAVAAVGYLWLEARLHRAGTAWAAHRTIAWLAGVAALAVATSSGVGRYAPVFFSVTMIQHLLLAVVAPLLLARAAPLTLALRALRRAEDSAWPGPREWTLAAVGSRPLRLLTHPAVAVLTWSVGVYGLYFTGAYENTLWSHAARLTATGYLLVTGYLLFWWIAGTDPRPAGRRSPASQARTAAAALAATVGAGILLATSERLIAEDWYVGLQRVLALDWPWGSVTALEDQTVGAYLFWLPTAATLLLVAAAQTRRHYRTARPDSVDPSARGDADPLDAEGSPQPQPSEQSPVM